MADTPASPPGQQPLSQHTPDTPASPPVVVKKYANRRLYNTETSSYITLENLAEMIRAGRDFVVYDAKSGDDITRGVLTQIIVEEESKGSAMLPTGFLRQLIGFYGGNLQGVVPRYLEHSMSSFARQQQQVRQMVERTFTPFLPTGMEEMSRQNMALFERAMSMWNPLYRSPENEAQAAEPTEPAMTNPPVDAHAELDRLRHEVESLRHQLAAAHAAAIIPAPPMSPVSGPVSHPLSGPVSDSLSGPVSSPVPDNAPPNVVSDTPDAASRPMRRPTRNKTAVEP